MKIQDVIGRKTLQYVHFEYTLLFYSSNSVNMRLDDIKKKGYQYKTWK